MKIAFFCDEYPPNPHGGIGTFVLTLAEVLVKHGHLITVVEFGNNSGARVTNGVNIVTLEKSVLPKVAWLINRFRLWRWIVNANKERSVDIFEIPDYQGWLPFPIFNSRVVVVVRLHLSATIIHHFASGKKYIRDFLCEYLTLLFHKNWIGVSQYILTATKSTFKLNPFSSNVIYNPITTSGLLMDDATNYSLLRGNYVLFVGSMTERKGVLTLAKAAKHLIDKSNPIQFVFVGPDSDYREGKISSEIFRIVNDRKYVKFVGRIDHIDALRWMKNALVVVLPSKLESFGLVPVEAMALGVPVIYTNAGPGSEIINHGANGFLVDPDDHVSIANHISSLMNDPSLASTLGEEGKKTVLERFDIDKILMQNISIYKWWIHVKCLTSSSSN